MRREKCTAYFCFVLFCGYDVYVFVFFLIHCKTPSYGTDNGKFSKIISYTERGDSFTLDKEIGRSMIHREEKVYGCCFGWYYFLQSVSFSSAIVLRTW